MAEEQGDELERLRRENEEIHRVNLELLLRQSELTHENRRLWEFVMEAKRFSTFLQRSDYHSDSGEYAHFDMGFARLGQWIQWRLKELESEANRETA